MSPDQPRVTAIITCMTDAERPYVGAAIDSVLTQTVPTPLVLCVTDTNTWIDELVADRAGVHLLRMPLSPLGTVRNTGLAEVGTDLVAFLDGDDAWHREKVERQVALLDAHRLDVLGSQHVLIREDDQPFFYAFAQNIPMPSSWLGRTEVFRDRPFSSRHIGEDVQLWLEMQEELRCGIAERFLLRYRVRAGSLSQSTPSMVRKLRYEQRSHRPGGRALLLVGSRTANLALRVLRAVQSLVPRKRGASAIRRVR